MHIKMSLNIGSKVLENGVTVFFKDDFSDCRLYHDLPKGDYVIIDFSSVWENDFMFFAMKTIEKAKDISRNVIMTYQTEAFHSKFWEFTCQILEDQGFNRAMIIDAGINLGFEGYVNTGHRLKNDPEVQERIKELEQNLETNVDVITEIERQYEFAKANGHTNSAIKALELLSRIRGAKSDKEGSTSPEGLETNIVEALEVLGKKKVMELISRCKFNQQLELEKEQHQQHQEKISEELQE